MDFLEYNANEDIIYEKIKSNIGVLKLLNPCEMYSVICLSLCNENLKQLLIENKNVVLNNVSENFTLFDCMSVYNLKRIDEFHDEANKIINDIFDKVFHKDTKLFILKANRYFREQTNFTKNEIINYIFSYLKELKTDEAANLIFNLSLLPDFKEEMKTRYSLIELLIDRYQKFDPELVYLGTYTGSSIIGLLIKNDEQYILSDYVNELLKKYNEKLENIKCVGGGSTCLVYKIGDSVLKIGEKRNCRKILVNHRILASQIRKVIKRNDEDEFYIEVMKYIKTGDVTKEEMEELVYDLHSQFIDWQDPKPENCGVLDDDDENRSYLPFDYVNVAAIVDNPIKKELFLKRKRKVVVLDNDNMYLDPKNYWK